MEKLPAKITPCPIQSAVVEIRFDTSEPTEAVFGLLFAKLRNEFPNKKTFPLENIPREIREKDPNLKYSATQLLSNNENMNILIGSHIIAIEAVNEYPGWEQFQNKALKIYDILNSSLQIDRLVRLGLRYINVFEGDIFDNIDLEISLRKSKFTHRDTSFRTIIEENNFRSQIQVVNKVAINNKSDSFDNSVIDIDTSIELDEIIDSTKFKELINNAHDIEKKLFFDLLSEDFLNQYEPQY